MIVNFDEVPLQHIYVCMHRSDNIYVGSDEHEIISLPKIYNEQSE